MIYWPAIISLKGDAELIQVADQAEWESDPQLHRQPYHAEDCLIDAQGNSFALVSINGRTVPQPTGIPCRLDEVLDKVRRHCAQQGTCCVAKLSAPSIAEAIAILADPPS